MARRALAPEQDRAADHEGGSGESSVRGQRAGTYVDSSNITPPDYVADVNISPRRGGVSHNAPYRHFPDREALLAALAAEGFSMLGERLRGQPARAMGEAYVRFALEQPQRFRLMFGGVLPMEKYPELREAAQAAHGALVEAFKDLPRPELAAAAAWSLVHGLSHLLLDGHFAQADREAFVREVLGAVRFAQRAA